jgi:hypothetical protein
MNKRPKGDVDEEEEQELRRGKRERGKARGEARTNVGGRSVRRLSRRCPANLLEWAYFVVG